jgi:hypothetical protein
MLCLLINKNNNLRYIFWLLYKNWLFRIINRENGYQDFASSPSYANFNLTDDFLNVYSKLAFFDLKSRAPVAGMEL